MWAEITSRSELRDKTWGPAISGIENKVGENGNCGFLDFVFKDVEEGLKLSLFCKL